MKVFQIENGICHWDATLKFPSVEDTVGKFPTSVLFVEAPEEVFEGWGYLNGEFIKPTPPEGWLYDDITGTFYPERDIAPSKMPTTEERVVQLEEQLAQADEMAIELYEAQAAQEEINSAQDEALISLYEMIGGQL